MTNKKITVLGSTGSVGEQALDVADEFGMRVGAISANSNVKRAEEQARKFKVDAVAMADERAARELKVRLGDTQTKIFSGAQGICDMIAEQKSDVVLNSIIGLPLTTPQCSMHTGSSGSHAGPQSCYTQLSRRP